MEEVKILHLESEDASELKLPLYLMSVSAGVPVPVEDVVDQEIDLNQYLIEHPQSTFFAQVQGVELKHSGINDGDILIIDASLEPKDNKIVLVSVNGDLGIKRYRLIEGNAYLESGNHTFTPLGIEPYVNYEIIGTVTRIIHSL